MKPKVLVLVQSKFRDYLLPERITGRLGEFADYEILADPGSLPQAEFAGRFPGVRGLLTSWEIRPLDQQALTGAVELEIIAHAGGMVRYFLPAEAFEWRPGLTVCNASGVMAQPVAEYALTSALACLRHLWFFRDWVRGSDRWEAYPDRMNVSLLRKKVGVVGLGQIAREFIALARPFRVELLVHSSHLSREEAAREGLVKAPLEEIFSSCDVILLSAANTPQNRQMVDRELLRRIKPGAVFVNIARGALVDEAALIEELATGRFMAAIDVTDPEPPLTANPLRDMPNVLLTPHIAGPTPEQRIWMMEEAVENLERFFRGRPVSGLVDSDRYRYMA